MPLSIEDARTLRRSGFIAWEVKKYDEAVAPDGTPQVINLQTKTWQAAIASRRAWVSDKIRRGWPKAQIAGAIMGYYIMKKERNPFDFIKIEYKPPKKLTDYQEATKKRVEQRVKDWDYSHRGGRVGRR